MEVGQIIHGDALEELRKLPSDSVDCEVTDPPYGYSFMGKNWDKAVPSVEIWKESLRVLKPGAFAFVMSSPRQDVLSQMIVRLGEAGFDTGFTSIYWAYASGFPKASNISLQIDKQECMRQLIEKLGRKPIKTKELDEFADAWQAFRKVIGSYQAPDGINRKSENQKPHKEIGNYNLKWGFEASGFATSIKEPTTENAKMLNGSFGGFQPKPAVEVIIVCMKPLSEKTFVDQALSNGHGVTWLDNGRMPFQSEVDAEVAENKNAHLSFGSAPRENKIYGEDKRSRAEQGDYDSAKGRFPANLLVSDDVLNDGRVMRYSVTRGLSTGKSKFFGEEEHEEMKTGYTDEGSFSRYFDVDRWFSETVKKLPKEVRETFPFLIEPKASKSERNERLEKLNNGTYLDESRHDKDAVGCNNPRNRTGKMRTGNIHPTVKPLQLMSYLITLGSRLNDLVLDPFVGSGTTCLAAKMLGRRFIGIEKEVEYVRICEARVNGLKTLFEFDPPAVGHDLACKSQVKE
jgi:DNA modification methylase